MTADVRILVSGHLPSVDNIRGIRSRDQDVEKVALKKWQNSTRSMLPAFRVLGQLIDRTYCPSTLRHHTTARLLTDALGIAKPIVDERINNIDYGKFKGKAIQSTPQPHTALQSPFEGGESWDSMAQRWRNFFECELKQFPGSSVLLAGQSPNAIRMLMHICHDLPLKEAVARPLQPVQFFKPEREKQDLRGCVWQFSW